MFSSSSKNTEENEPNDDESSADKSSDSQPSTADSESATPSNDTKSEEAEKTDEKQSDSDSKPSTNTTEMPDTAKNTTKAPAIKPPPKFIRTKLTLDIDQKYPSLSSKQINEYSRVLSEFEKAERARRDLEVASNALESLVYDTAVKLEEEWLKRKDFVDDFNVRSSNNIKSFKCLGYSK
jgi:hypothetical protein